MQLIAHLTSEDTASLDALNRRLWAYVEGEYHRSSHRSLAGDTPLERWARSADQVHFPDPHLDLDALFLFETTRRVQRDRIVLLNGVIYEVDVVLVGEKVMLCYDFVVFLGRLLEVWYDNWCIYDVIVFDVYVNCFVK